MPTPAARSAALLREQGYRVSFLERWIPCSPKKGAPPGKRPGRVRKDAFGFGDLLAIKAGEAPLMVQVTVGAVMAAHVAKAEGLDDLRVWLATGSRFVVHGWSRKGHIGARKLWTCDVQEVTR